MESFFSFQIVFFGVIKLLLGIGLGFSLAYMKWLQKRSLDLLARLLIWICLPALVFVKIAHSFSFSEYASWWILPLGAIVMALIGICLSGVVAYLFRVKEHVREFVVSSAFQNCGYLPMSLIIFITSGAVGERLLIYIFLYLMGFNVIMWTFVPACLARSNSFRIILKAVINPPSVTIAIAFLSVALLGTGWIPAPLESPLTWIGNASFPLSLILVGATLFYYCGYASKDLLKIAGGVIMKLIVIPAFFLIVLLFSSFLSKEHSFILFLEAVMPIAVSVVLIGHEKQANNEFLSGAVFYSHLFSVLTIPLWLTLFSRFQHLFSL